MHHDMNIIAYYAQFVSQAPCVPCSRAAPAAAPSLSASRASRMISQNGVVILYYILYYIDGAPMLLGRAGRVFVGIAPLPDAARASFDAAV